MSKAIKPPTAEEILDDHYIAGMHWRTVNRHNVLIGMRVHTEAHLRAFAEKIIPYIELGKTAARMELETYITENLK